MLRQYFLERSQTAISWGIFNIFAVITPMYLLVCNAFVCFPFFKIISFKVRLTWREHITEKTSIHWFIPQMSTTAGNGSDRSQELPSILPHE